MKNNNYLQNGDKNTAVDINKFKKAAEDGKLEDYINNNLSSDVSNRLKDILSDKSKTQKLLSTPQAKELMKKLGIK